MIRRNRKRRKNTSEGVSEKQMGEEDKQPDESKKPVEEQKKEEPPKSTEENKDEKKSEESKAAAEQPPPPPPPPPPPQEIVLRVFMHCEGCARKVRRCLKGFEGVEDVITDCKISQVVVKGEKADPLKVFERVQKKSHRQVELISPIPKPQPDEPNKPEEKEVVKSEEKKVEPPPVLTVVLGVYMHCDACAQEIKKRMQRMKGVESAEPDLKNSQVTVKGVFEPEKLVDYVYKKTGKHAVIVKVDPDKKEEVKEEEKTKEGTDEKKKDDEGEKEAKKGEEGGSKEENEGGTTAGEPGASESEDTKMELKKNEFYYHYPHNYHVYPQSFVQQQEYPPQMFSDENPNACTVM